MKVKKKSEWQHACKNNDDMIQCVCIKNYTWKYFISCPTHLQPSFQLLHCTSRLSTSRRTALSGKQDGCAK